MFSQIQETGERKFEHCVNISTPKSLPLAREREIKEAERRPGLFICSAGLWTHAGGVPLVPKTPGHHSALRSGRTKAPPETDSQSAEEDPDRPLLDGTEAISGGSVPFFFFYFF